MTNRPAFSSILKPMCCPKLVWLPSSCGLALGWVKIGWSDNRPTLMRDLREFLVWALKPGDHSFDSTLDDIAEYIDDFKMRLTLMIVWLHWASTQRFKPSHSMINKTDSLYWFHQNLLRVGTKTDRRKLRRSSQRIACNPSESQLNHDLLWSSRSLYRLLNVLHVRNPIRISFFSLEIKSTWCVVSFLLRVDYRVEFIKIRLY